MALAVYEITDGYTADTTPSGFAIRRFLIVEGNIFNSVTPQTEAMGLPKYLSAHNVNPNLVCRRRRIEDVVNAEPDPAQNAVVVRCEYTPVNWSGLRTRWGSRTENGSYVMYAPSFRRVEIEGPPGFVWIRNPDQPLLRSRSYKYLTTTAGALSLDQVVGITAQNAGRLYKFDEFADLWWFLEGTTAWTDVENRTFVRTKFYRNNPFPAMQADPAIGRDHPLPELPALAEYQLSFGPLPGDGGRPIVTVTAVNTDDPRSPYLKGDELPWL